MPTKYTKPLYRKLNKLTHKVIYQICMFTSEKNPEWRTATINFLYEIFNLMEKNPAINIHFLRMDGFTIYYKNKKIIYFHIAQKHLLGMTSKGDLLYSRGRNYFKTPHNGSHDRMWRINTVKELGSIINFIKSLKKLTPAEMARPRSIPQWVKEFVFERDEGKCVVCGSKIEIHFDHILPFSMGGTSILPDNIQLLCANHNLEKSASLKY